MMQQDAANLEAGQIRGAEKGQGVPDGSGRPVLVVAWNDVGESPVELGGWIIAEGELGVGPGQRKKILVRIEETTRAVTTHVNSGGSSPWERLIDPQEIDQFPPWRHDRVAFKPPLEASVEPG